MTSGAPRFRVVRAAFAVQPSARAIVGCDVRHVAFLRAEQDGRVGFGECAPLAGVHAEGELEGGGERGGIFTRVGTFELLEEGLEELIEDGFNRGGGHRAVG